MDNPQQDTWSQVRERYLAYVSQMQEQQADVGPLGEAIEHFYHKTSTFAAGLFHQARPADIPGFSYGEEAGLPFVGLGHRGKRKPVPIDKSWYI